MKQQRKKDAYNAMAKMILDKLDIDTDNQGHSFKVVPSEEGWSDLKDVHLLFCDNCTIVYKNIHSDYINTLRNIALMTY